jgi:small subunit ribosomal protein S9
MPLRLTNAIIKYDVEANVCGGGITGQAGALKHAISRALLAQEPELKDMLRKNGLLTRDPRAKERKKYGQKGARKRFQWTKR